MLSNKDILKELGKNILIHPFDPKNNKGSSIRLSASKNAWSLNEKTSIYKNGEIIIKPKDIALIETEESIHITKYLSGTLHLPLLFVAGGIGNISTIIDPGTIGPLLVVLQNNSKDIEFHIRIDEVEKQKIKINEYSENIIELPNQFILLSLYYLKRPANIVFLPRYDGNRGILEYYGIKITENEKSEYINECKKFDAKVLKNQMKRSSNFINFKNKSNHFMIFHKKFIETPNEICEKVIYFVKKYSKINTKYKYGRHDLLNHNIAMMDCSGFVINCYKYALENTKYELPFNEASVSDIYNRWTMKTKKPRSGDIMFMGYNKNNPPAHICIYLGKQNDEILFADCNENETLGLDGVNIRHYKAQNLEIFSYGRLKMQLRKNNYLEEL